MSIELESGKTAYSNGTFPCDDVPGCLYCIDGRCVFNVSRIKVRQSRACYEELLMDEYECQADYEMGLI